MSNVAPDAAVSAAILSIQASIEHLQEDVSRMAAAAVAPVRDTPLLSSSGRWSESPAARHLDHVCDNLVLAVRTLGEVEQRSSDPALRQLCRNALDRIAHVDLEAPGAT
jgi:hypothetical protein